MARASSKSVSLRTASGVRVGRSGRGRNSGVGLLTATFLTTAGRWSSCPGRSVPGCWPRSDGAPKRRVSRARSPATALRCTSCGRTSPSVGAHGQVFGTDAVGELQPLRRRFIGAGCHDPDWQMKTRHTARCLTADGRRRDDGRAQLAHRELMLTASKCALVDLLVLVHGLFQQIGDHVAGPIRLGILGDVRHSSAPTLPGIGRWPSRRRA